MTNTINQQLQSVPVGIVGLGGYAGAMCRFLLNEPQAEQGPRLQLSAVYEPNLAAHGELVKQLKARSVRIMPSYEALLNEPVGCIWLPIPIHLHRPFAEQAMAAGKRVLCEKPVAGTIDDVDALIAARDRSGGAFAVGFQDIYDSQKIRLKRRLLEGAIGRIERVSVLGCWPRPTTYYGRNAWAGRARVESDWILDSPVNNAMAHFVNLAAFLAGPEMDRSIEPERLEAELYRAYPIENFDTASLRVEAAGGVSLLVLMTHACSRTIDPTIVLHGTSGCCRLQTAQGGTLTNNQGEERFELSSSQGRRDMAAKIARWVLGQPTDGPVATLELSRAHALIVSGAADAAPVHTIPDSAFESQPTKDGAQLVVRGIESAMEAAAAAGRMLHESGAFDWTVPAGAIDLRGYRHFSGRHFK